MNIENVLLYMQKPYPDLRELLQKANGKFRLYTGYLKSDEDNHLLDTIIEHERHPSVIMGIKTLIRYPYFNFVYKSRDPESIDEVIINTQYDSIFDIYDVIYDRLVSFFPCGLFKSKERQYKIIYDDKHSIFAIDLFNYRPIIIDKFATWRRNLNALDRTECIDDTITVQFNINGVNLTVKEYALVEYLIDFYKVLKIYRGDLMKEN